MLYDVEESLISRFTQIYNPLLRYLKKEQIDLEMRYGLGFFEVPEVNVFAADGRRSEHVTESETQLMITQMMWPFFAEMLANRGLGDLRLEHKDFFRIAKHGIFLAEETKKYRHFMECRHGIEGRIQLVDVVKKSARDDSCLWFTKVKTELYPPLEYRRHDSYNEFDATLVLKPEMVLGKRNGA